MKKSLQYTCLFMLLAVISFAQKPVDTNPAPKESAGFDITALAIGLVVGLAIGYFLGSRTAKK